jgi:non-ribosomal peptide synthetase-like protein
LHEFFEVQAALRPEHVALVALSGTLTYAEVEETANRLARYLRSQGVGRDQPVGMLLPRSPEVYITLLAILKAGGAYVPLDPDYPPERIAYILSDCGARVLVTATRLASKAAQFTGKTILLDQVTDELAQKSSERLSPAETGVKPEDMSYIIYTSGSTGKPKGVQIEHRSACNLVQVEREMFQVRPEDRVFQGFSIAFDASVEEVWLAFASGASLVVGTSEMVHAGPALSRMLTAANVTVFSTVPTLLLMLDEDIPTVHLLIVGGEACPPDLVQRWCRPGRRMVNTYGPTEATVIATAGECTPGKPVTIGGPIPTYTVVLLDENLQPAGPGQPGELYLGGVCLARGYVGRPDLTAERFIPIPPLPPDTRGLLAGCDRLYRTGDLGRWTADGEIEYLGRIDSQVKLRGFRVELSEIEAVILCCPGIKAAAVNVHQDAAGTQQLVGYVVPATGQEIDEDAIRAILRSRLPGYMVPAILETLESLPTLPSGKVDRRSLPAPKPRAAKAAANRIAPRTDLEKQIAAVWEELFAPQPVSIRDDFFLDLGGHSLLAAKLVSRLRKLPDLSEVAVLDLYKYPTIESLAGYLERRRQLPADVPGPAAGAFRPVSAAAHRLCGLLQLPALYLILGFASIQFLVPYAVHTLAVAKGYSALASLLFALASLLACYPLMLALAIIIKWLVIGRFQPGRYPLWGVYYYRWWFVRSILAYAPRWFLVGTPLLNLYFRLLGARIGKNVHLATDEAVAMDLLTIGDDTHVGADTVLSGCTVEGGMLRIEPIVVGRRCFVGSQCVLRPGAILGDDVVVEDLSLVRSGIQVRAGKRRAGSPAAPVPSAGKEQEREPPRSPSALGRTVFALVTALCFFLFPALIITALFPGMVLLDLMSAELGGYWYLAFTPLVALSFVVLLCLEIVLLKWLIIGRVKPGKYPLYGLFHLRKWFVDQLLDLSLNVLRPLYASLYTVPFYRLLGARVGRDAEISTAAFVSPDLLTVGEGSFVADAVSLGAVRYEGGYVTVGEVRIGTKTFIGNSALLPPGSAVGNDCLVGCLSTLPAAAEDALKPGATWLGSPAFSLPKRQESTAFPEEQTFRPTPRLRAGRALVEAVRILIVPTCFLVLTCLVLSVVQQLLGVLPGWQVALLFPLFFAASGLAACLFTIALKWIVMGRYRPRERPLWSPFVWGSELVSSVSESLADNYLVGTLVGTPYICMYFRLLGTKIGKRVFMDTTELTEFDLVEVGDEAAVNSSCTLQTHLFEDRVMKMSYVHVGDRCSVGASSLVLYDTFMGEGSALEDLSLLMKGETLPAGSTWTGIPAIPTAQSPVDTLPRDGIPQGGSLLGRSLTRASLTRGSLVRVK